MYPETLEFEKGIIYYEDRDCFTAASTHLVHAYMHGNYRCKMHAHQFYEMNIISSGEGRHYIGDTYVPARVGDVFIIPPEVNHGYYAGDALDVCHLLLRADFMSSYRAELSHLPAFALLFDIEPQIRRTSGRGYNLHVERAELVGLLREFTSIVVAEQEGEYTYENVLTLAFIGNMGRLLRKNLQGESMPVQAGELLRVMEYSPLSRSARKVFRSGAEIVSLMP